MCVCVHDFTQTCVCAALTACVCVCVLQYESSSLGLISSRLRTTLNRIQESLIEVVRTLSPLVSPPSSVITLHAALLTQTSSSRSTSPSSPFNASIHRDQARPRSPRRPKMHYGSSLCGRWSLSHTCPSLFKWQHQGWRVWLYYPQSLLLSDIIHSNN